MRDISGHTVSCLVSLFKHLDCLHTHLANYRSGHGPPFNLKLRQERVEKLTCPALPCPQLPTSPGTCKPRLTDELSMNVGPMLLGAVFQSQHLLPLSHWRVVRGSSHSVCTQWWRDGMIYLRGLNSSACIFTPGHTSSSSTRDWGSVSMLSKTWLVNLPYCEFIQHLLNACYDLAQGSANSSCKRPDSRYLRLCRPWSFSVTIIPQWPPLWSWKTAVDSARRNGQAVFQ